MLVKIVDDIICFEINGIIVDMRNNSQDTNNSNKIIKIKTILKNKLKESIFFVKVH